MTFGFGASTLAPNSIVILCTVDALNFMYICSAYKCVVQKSEDYIVTENDSK